MQHPHHTLCWHSNDQSRARWGVMRKPGGGSNARRRNDAICTNQKISAAGFGLSGRLVTFMDTTGGKVPGPN
eukprot:924247-Ditylum_brightwellii.AAC.1